MQRNGGQVVESFVQIVCDACFDINIPPKETNGPDLQELCEVFVLDAEWVAVVEADHARVDLQTQVGLDIFAERLDDALLQRFLRLP